MSEVNLASSQTSSPSFDDTIGFEGAEELRQAWRDGLTPDPALTVSEWADQHRVLSPRASAEPGRYRTDRTPYMREIMDALSPMHPARRIVFMKAAQVGATEAGNNWIGYVIHHAPGPMMAVQPTVELAKRFSRQRIEPLIEDTPLLRQRVKPARSRDAGNTVLSKEFPAGLLVITGANSAVGLRSMPARYLFLDEVDVYPSSAGDEGDPVALAEARSRTFSWRAKVFLTSTPTIKGLSRIEREYEASDQRRYFVPCPHCAGMQWLKFERLRWQKADPQSARYVCEHCDAQIAEQAKSMMLSRGEWRATAEPKDPASIGFHISGLYSPIGWQSWASIAHDWESAQGSDVLIKAVKNTALGETWQEKGEAPEWQRLYERRDELWGALPGKVLILTAGADVQHDRIEVDVWGWGRGLESWLVDHIVLEGDPSRYDVWRQLTALLGQTWARSDKRHLRIARLAIDSGDGRLTATVYTWVRSIGAGQVMAVKGVEGFDRSTPVDGPTYVDINERARRVRRGVRLWKVSVSVFKSETYRFLGLDRPTDEELSTDAGYPPGYVHVPQGTNAEWIKQLVSERLVAIRDRRKFERFEWQQIRERNEALDNRVYARAALWVMGADRRGAAFWDAMEAAALQQSPDGVPRNAQSAATTPRPRVVQSRYMLDLPSVEVGDPYLD